MNDNTLFSLVKFIPIAKYRRNLREKIRARQQARILAAQTANLRDEASSIPLKEESDLKQYSEWRFDLDTNKNYFIKEASDTVEKSSKAPKIFAYYLPQFHAIPENDENYGKGFTEWTNVAAASPQFFGHYQPKIPYDLGFYNLTNIDSINRQVELAKKYGIDGFCFYYYWFSGKKVLDEPLDLFLASDLKFSFHLMWANENWSKRWDGGNAEIILKQDLTEKDFDLFFEDILPYISDPRYEKIDNRPILAIYRPHLFQKDLFKKFLASLDSNAKKHGFPGFYFLGTNAVSFSDPEEYGLEGLIEFPPHGVMGSVPESENIKWFNLNSTMHVVDIQNWIDSGKFITDVPYKIFRCCFPSWDNTPRKNYSGGFVFNMGDDSFEKWLSGNIEWTMKNHKQSEQYVYINAWNEWAEGAMLEPTTRYGYKNLQTVRNVVEMFENKSAPKDH